MICGIDINAYDAAEVGPVRKCDPESDEEWTPPDGYEACEPDDPNIAMWCVYLHRIEGGVECIADCPDAGTANLIAGALERAIPQLCKHGMPHATALAIFAGV